MNAPISPELARACAALDQATDRDALAVLRVLLGDLARISYQAERVVLAVPTCGADKLALSAIRSQVGVAWHSVELAQAALPLQRVEL